MREIKFRAWYKGDPYPLDPNDLEYHEKPRMIFDVQGAYDGGGFEDKYHGFGYVSCFEDFMDDEQFELMQYTGLTDKNGKEIYEGDIVNSWAGINDIYLREVVRDDNEPAIVFKPKTGFTLCKSNEHLFEIIGNIYENPELLEGVK